MRILGIILLLMIFAGCGEKKIEESKFLFGTYIKMVVYSKDTKGAKKAINEAFAEIERVDREINSRSEGSDLNQVNKNAGEWVQVSDETIGLIKDSMEMSEISGGRYDITVADVFEIWGFEDEKVNEVPDDKLLKEKLEKVGYKQIDFDGNKMRIGKDQKIDAGSFLKGYAISKARRILEESGINSAFISAVSSIETIGIKPDGNKWRIGIQNPEKNNEMMEIVNLESKALGVSGDYQTFVEIDGKKYHHIIDATTGYPYEENKMVVVLGDDSYKTDMYSTALFVIEAKDIIDFANEKDIEVMVVDKNMNRYYSDKMKEYFN